MYNLEKMSAPGWEFRSKYIEHIYMQLDDHVCGLCKQTEAQYKAATKGVGVDYEDGWDYFKPETFALWSHREKIEWLLGTPCGCEFDFYNEAEGPGLAFKDV